MLRALGLGWPTWSTLSRKGSEHGQVDQTIKPAGLSALTHGRERGKLLMYFSDACQNILKCSGNMIKWVCLHKCLGNACNKLSLFLKWDNNIWVWFRFTHICIGLLMLTKGYQNAVIDYFRIYLKFREWERWFKFALRVKYDVLSVGFFRGKEINIQLIKYT